MPADVGDDSSTSDCAARAAARVRACQRSKRLTAGITSARACSPIEPVAACSRKFGRRRVIDLASLLIKNKTIFNHLC